MALRASPMPDGDRHVHVLVGGRAIAAGQDADRGPAGRLGPAAGGLHRTAEAAAHEHRPGLGQRAAHRLRRRQLVRLALRGTDDCDVRAHHRASLGRGSPHPLAYRPVFEYRSVSEWQTAHPPCLPGPRMPRALQMLGWRLRPGPFLERCRDRYGDAFTLRPIPRETAVVLSDPDAVEAGLHRRSALAARGRGKRPCCCPLLGDGTRCCCSTRTPHMAPAQADAARRSTASAWPATRS